MKDSLERSAAFFCLWTAIFLLSGVNVSGSKSIQIKSDQEPLKHEVEVTLKLVQVYVVDKNGKPVTDLEKTDFEIYDNGERKKITDFEKHILSAPSVKTLPQQETPKLAPETRMNRKIFLFFDFAFNSAWGIKNSRKAALYFIDTQLQPSDEAGVISYSKFRGLALDVDLTTDHHQVRKVVEGFGIKEHLGRAEDIETDSLESKFGDREIYKQEVLDFFHRMSDLAKSLGYVEGGKHIILFSAGVISRILFGSSSMPLGRRSVDFPIDNPMDPGDVLLQRTYEKMTKELTSSNTMVYPIHSEGMTGFARPRNSDPNRTDPVSDHLGIEQLRLIAKNTGGKYFGNIHHYEDIAEEIQNLTGTYYVLGYPIARNWDGKYHDLKVKVKREGCEVHAQRGYFNPKPFADYTKLEKELHLRNLALTEVPQFQADVIFPLSALSSMTQGKPGILMISKLPVEGEAWLLGDKVEVNCLVFNEKDELIDSKRWEVDFSRFPRKTVYQYTCFSVSPGTYKCRVVLRHSESGKAAVALSGVTVSGIPDSGLVLDSPLLLLPSKNALYLQGVTSEEELPGKKQSELLARYPYDASSYGPVLGELPQGSPSVFAVVKCSFFGIEEPKLTLDCRLIQEETGAEIPVSVSLLKKYKEKDSIIVFLELRLGDVQPGSYRLDFLAKEKESNLTSQAAMILTIKQTDYELSR